MPSRGEVTFEGWPAGINNVAKDTAVPDGALRDALNVDLDDRGKPRRRSGRTKVYSGVRTHSLYNASCGPVFVEGSTLKRLLPDHTDSAIGDLLSGDRVCYTKVNGITYFTNGYDTWRLFANGALKANGVPDPSGQPLPSFTPSAGALPAGRYLFAVSFVDSEGEESGASQAIEVSLSQPGTLTLGAIPQSSDASHVKIYGTEPNGAVLREYATISMGVTSYNLTQVIQGPVLSTQFFRRMPPGRLIRYFQGRLYVADGDTLWYSEAMRYGLNNPSDGFISFTSDITVVQPVADGLFVVADKTYFLAGTNPRTMSQRMVSDSTGVFGTGEEFLGSIFDPELTGSVGYWYSERGATLGLQGGIIRPLMENTVALPQYEEGATVLREQNGIRQAVTALRGSGTAAEFALGDEISVTVKRNGIVL